MMWFDKTSKQANVKVVPLVEVTQSKRENKISTLYASTILVITSKKEM